MAYHYTYDKEEKPYTPPTLKTDRSMWRLMLFELLTCGIYNILFFIPFSFDLDRVAPKRDRSRTLNYVFALLLSLVTFSVVLTVWHYQIAQRVEEALERRKIDYEFTTGTFWGWYFFGSFILVGQFVYFHKLCRAMNLLCADYNANPTVE